MPCKPTEEYPLSPNIVTTFLELGNATSHNLEFSHSKNVFVSYGEETITENNLLEIRRRHPDRVHIETFSKAKEAKSGADWEWHILGQKLTLKMRVQAKRVQRDGKLKIKHKVKSSGMQQRDLLLARAEADRVKPLYCIYCTEPQRSFWKKLQPSDDLEEYQTGCLLVDAHDVSVTTTKLYEIEHKCIPWHYLFEQADSARWHYLFEQADSARWKHELIKVVPGDKMYFARDDDDIVPLRMDDSGNAGKGRRQAPTIADLNRGWNDSFDPTGVTETNEEDIKRFRLAMGGRTYLADQAKIWDCRIHRMLVIDVRPER